jgi:hypothetical protein
MLDLFPNVHLPRTHLDLRMEANKRALQPPGSCLRQPSAQLDCNKASRPDGLQEQMHDANVLLMDSPPSPRRRPCLAISLSPDGGAADEESMKNEGCALLCNALCISQKTEISVAGLCGSLDCRGGGLLAMMASGGIFFVVRVECGMGRLAMWRISLLVSNRGRCHQRLLLAAPSLLPATQLFHRHEARLRSPAAELSQAPPRLEKAATHALYHQRRHALPSLRAGETTAEKQLNDHHSCNGRIAMQHRKTSGEFAANIRRRERL